MEWIKVESFVKADVVNTGSKLLLHAGGLYSIGCPYDVDLNSDRWQPKMSVEYYMELPDYPEEFSPIN